jgi:FkbM family methyltransferase
MKVAEIKIARPRQIRPCKICSTASPLYGSVDFNKNCEARRGLVLPEAGILVGYNRCPRCGFLFTPAFDGWGREEYAQAIYNEHYILVDPDYKQTRPTGNAAMLAQTFAADKGHLSLLDFGGGNGILAQTLVKDGFQSALTYDPFNPEFAKLPGGRFNVVSCFETLEHVPDPRRQIAEIAKCVGDEGLVFFSTLVQPADFDELGLDWWYVGPRNGHISLFSRRALTEAWNRQGFKIASFNDNLHIAFRKIPAFAKHLVPDDSLAPSISPLRSALGENVSPTTGTTDASTGTEIEVAAPYQLVAVRHGVMLCNTNDFYMGKALITYGECCETETQFLNQLAKHGGMVVEVGANMGIHTIALARFLADQDRKLLVFEPQPVIFQQLCANLALNGLTNVRAWPYACGAEKGIATFAAPNYHGLGNFGAVSMEASESQAVVRVPCVRVDEMVEDEKVGLLKIDVEGFERKVLEGAAATIRRCRPLLYVENDRVDYSRELIEWLWAADYQLWWHMPFLFNPKNYFGVSENLYGGVASFNMVGIPKEMQANVRDLKVVDDASFHPLAALEQQAAVKNG